MTAEGSIRESGGCAAGAGVSRIRRIPGGDELDEVRRRGDPCTPPAFPWVQFSYAIDKGLRTFMEKPVTVDGPTTRRMLKPAELSEKKNLKVGVGLMVRHCRARQELLDCIRSGQIGDIVCMRAYRMGQGGGTAGPRPEGVSELTYQIQRFHAFLWASGGVFSDYYIHQIDECSWMKGAWPVEAHAVGGRHYRGDSLDQNFDTFGYSGSIYISGRNEIVL